MKLYTNNGRWVGTQADAKQFGEYEHVDVPTDKPTLIDFLNAHRVGAHVDDAVLDYIDALEDFGPAPTKTHQNTLSVIDHINLKEAFEKAGLVREYIRRVYSKVEEEK